MQILFMSENIIEFQILQKKVRITGLPPNREGDLLKEIIRKVCSQKAVYFLFSEVEFRFEQMNTTSTPAFVIREDWFKHGKEIVHCDVNNIHKLIAKGEGAIGHELSHLFQQREIRSVERLYKLRQRFSEDYRKYLEQMDQAVQQLQLLKDQNRVNEALTQLNRLEANLVLKTLTELRMLILSFLEGLWTEGTAEVIETQIDYTSGEYISDQDMLKHRLQKASDVAETFHDQWQHLTQELQRLDLVKVKAMLASGVNGSVIGNHDVALRIIGKAMVEEFLVLTKHSIWYILDRDFKAFIVEYEKCTHAAGLHPLVSLSSGKGIIDIKQTMQPLAILHDHWKKQA